MTDEARRQDALTAFEPQRRRLFGIAYRMLGSVSEAEDVVQDAWLRWQGADRASVREPAAFLATTVTRLCLNALSSARARRELYVGPWLPEPVSTTDDPTLGAERAEALSLAVLLLMERLTPAERAAYVLREAFVYSHRDIAAVLETTETNARQLVSRARAHVTAERAAPVEPGSRACDSHTCRFSCDRPFIAVRAAEVISNAPQVAHWNSILRGMTSASKDTPAQTGQVDG